jgi:hypothetical protein
MTPLLAHRTRTLAELKKVGTALDGVFLPDALRYSNRPDKPRRKWLRRLLFILRDQIVINELNRNRSPISSFNPSQHSAATEDANFSSPSDLKRQGHKERDLRTFRHATVGSEKHPAHGDVFGQSGFVSGAGRTSQRRDLLDKNARMTTAFFLRGHISTPEENASTAC